MIPLIQGATRGEISLPMPITMWMSLEYWSKQNINFNSTNDLGSRFLVGLGASTTIIPRTVLSAEVDNLLGDQYEWWSSYGAPGITFRLNAKVNFR
jgi:outer membrane receptor protein involved in Fe transport